MGASKPRGGDAPKQELCADVTCDNPAEVCDPVDGICKPGDNDSSNESTTVPPPELCAGVTCDNPAEVCDPVDGICKPQGDDPIV